MVQREPKTLITTSIRGSEASRILCKVLRHITPHSIYFKRGRTNIDQLIQFALSNDIEYIVLIHSKGNQASQIKVHSREGDNYILQNHYLEIFEFIDPKIFNYGRLPAKGPLSCPGSIRLLNPSLLEFFEKYFALEIKKSLNELWFVLDVNSNLNYVQFVDALTQKRFTMLTLKYREELL
jgi:hypothetical protein